MSEAKTSPMLHIVNGSGQNPAATPALKDPLPAPSNPASAPSNARNLREELEQVMKKNQLTQRDISKAIGKSPSSLSTWLRGKYEGRIKEFEDAVRQWLDAVRQDVLQIPSKAGGLPSKSKFPFASPAESDSNPQCKTD